jgi:hypothetical protein
MGEIVLVMAVGLTISGFFGLKHWKGSRDAKQRRQQLSERLEGLMDI